MPTDHTPRTEKAQCTHWLVGAKVGIPQMYDLRCAREPHDDGKHVCGSTDWNDAAGEYRA